MATLVHGMSRPPRQTAPLSRAGKLFALLGLTVAASGFMALRPEIMGLSVHPYLFVLLVMMPVVLRRLGIVPRSFLAIGAVFLVFAITAMIGDRAFLSETIKVSTAALTVLVAALAVHSDRDFIVGTAALLVAVVAIAAVGLVGGEALEQTAVTGAHFMNSVGDKNAFSVYALPVVLLGAFVVVELEVSPAFRIGLLVGSVFLAGAIFMTANRSGWLGVVLIVVMLVAHRLSIRTALLMAAILAVVYVVATRTAASSMIEHRVDQTRDGYSSDELRESLLENAIMLGVDHPLLGVGPTRLQIELARRTRIDARMVDTHNLFGYLIGAFGFPAAIAFVALAVSLWRIGRLRGPPDVRSARALVRMMVVLWAARGMFTREILYGPTACMGLGLAVGLYLLRERAALAMTATRRSWLRSAS